MCIQQLIIFNEKRTQQNIIGNVLDVGLVLGIYIFCIFFVFFCSFSSAVERLPCKQKVMSSSLIGSYAIIAQLVRASVL